MIIREDQMCALEGASERGFEMRMLERMRTYFPRHEQCLSETQLLDFVRLALNRAERHVLTTERSVALYLDLMCVLGSEFDTDPQIPWAAEILADRTFPAQSDRIDLLHSRGWEYATKISMDYDNDFESGRQSCLVATLYEIRRQSSEDLTPERARGLVSEILRRIKELFPLRCKVIGDECMALLMRSAVSSAIGYGIRSARGISLFAALMLVAGAGFDRDPQLPWASRILSDPAIDSPSDRVNRLYLEAIKSLRLWWGVEVEAAA